MGLITAYLALCVLIDYYSAQGIVDLEPSGVLYVCHGGTMSVTCRTSTDLLQWNVTLRYPSPQRTFERTLSHRGTIQMERPIITNLTTLSVSRSLDNSSLISTISTDNVTTDLNGTVITCSGKIPMMTGLLATENIEVIITRMMNIRNRINNVAMPSISEQFRLKDISITLVWTGTNGVSYSIRVDPEVAVNYTGRNSAQITVLYDTKYNISVIATLCEITTTNFAIIHHVTCPPLDSDNSPSADRVPALVGSVATFSCPPGMVLTGSNVTTCAANRQWHPDQNTVCKVKCSIPVVNSNITLQYNSTLEDSLLMFQCDDGLIPEDLFTARCYRNGSWIPNPSNHICSNSSAANCGDPSPPSDGYIELYTSTVEGAVVKRVHVCENGQQSRVEQLTCSPYGRRERINGSICSVIPVIGANYLIISLSSSFGVLVVLTVMIILPIIIIILLFKRKGLCQRNTPTSEHGSYNIGGGQVNHDQREYLSGAKQLNEQQSNIKSTYSLVQPYPPEDDNDQQTNSNASTKCQPRRLVYTDVIPFQQEELRVCPFDPNNKIQYSQVKGPSNDFPMQSLQTRSHSADHKSWSN